MPDTTNDPLTVAGLMELVSEYGQCRWSEGSSGATYLDPLGERRSREEAADLYKQIEEYAARLATPSVVGVDAAQPLSPAVLVNELVEQGQFFKRGEISEAVFIDAVNHYVQLARLADATDTKGGV